MSPQLMALFTALSYSTATLIALTSHLVFLWSAVFLTGGIPDVSFTAILTISIAGVIQPLIRFGHYVGIDKVGASRAVTLRNSYPILSVIFGIMFLHEEAKIANLAGTLLVVLGVILTSWRLEKQVKSYQWWHLFYPLGTALLTGIVHPIRRYAMILSGTPVYFAALVGLISFVCFVSYLILPVPRERLVWHPKAIVPFLVAGIFETLGILLLLTALNTGPVGIVSPIAATSPIWTVLLAAVLLRDLERITVHTVIGTLCVVGGVIAITLTG